MAASNRTLAKNRPTYDTSVPEERRWIYEYMSSNGRSSIITIVAVVSLCTAGVRINLLIARLLWYVALASYLCQHEKTWLFPPHIRTPTTLYKTQYGGQKRRGFEEVAPKKTYRQKFSNQEIRDFFGGDLHQFLYSYIFRTERQRRHHYQTISFVITVVA